jgi:16S rRNA (adenine1518-N6/adenine1519-N6)-dimethyltransferase
MVRQRMGQHFLVGPGWPTRILESLPLRESETWVEIGAGHGEMTQLLAAPCRRVITIEADARLAQHLESRVGRDPAKWPNVQVVPDDVLELDLGALAAGRFRVYGNLPYYITSPILHHLFEFAEKIISIHIVVQWEVAARIAARPGRRDYGYLSAACQFYTDPSIALRLPPGAFRPPPRVSSALVAMRLPGERASLTTANDQRFLEFVQACFGQKRKTLRNNLRARFSDNDIQQALSATKLRPDSRAEQLSLPQFASLFSRLSGIWKSLGGSR